MLEIGSTTSLHLSFNYLVLITLVAGKPQQSKIVTSSSSRHWTENMCLWFYPENIFYLKDIEFHFSMVSLTWKMNFRPWKRDISEWESGRRHEKKIVRHFLRKSPRAGRLAEWREKVANGAVIVNSPSTFVNSSPTFAGKPRDKQLVKSYVRRAERRAQVERREGTRAEMRRERRDAVASSFHEERRDKSSRGSARRDGPRDETREERL